MRNQELGIVGWGKNRRFVILSERSESKDLGGAIDDLRMTDPR